MSKINQIQNALRAIDVAKFQKLCDAYLHRLGYNHINPLGSLIGADKVTKGTPDTWVALPNGRYVFAEYTTEQNRLYKKFLGDLAKCFDTGKTKLPSGKLQEVVLCHNSVLKPAENDALAGLCKQHGCLFASYGMGPISYDLYGKYPGLAKDFLGVEVDTGQVVSQKEFVAAYGKGAFATPLDTTFRFREDEVRQVLQALAAGDLVLVSGLPGTGKSRLALECCAQFVQAHAEFQVKCIFNHGVDLFEDLRVYFSPPGSYLVLADDANRANRFEYILQLLREQRPDRRIKVIATVRDYALARLREEARNYGYMEVAVPALKDEQIKQIVQERFAIQHHVVLDRIADVAQGNPRLAMMAGKVLERENAFESIYDVSALYDEYFRSVREDLEELGNRSLLAVASLVTFFRSVDRTNGELMQAIHDAFQLSPEAFWEAAERLHDMEILDMYENEVVRVSDQVLATYLFYLAVFKERVLNFGTLLEHFFPSFQMRFVDALNPVLSAFDGSALAEQMRPAIDRTWKAMQERGDTDGLFHLISVFWFAMQTEALLYVRDAIRQMEPQSQNTVVPTLTPSSNLASGSLLSLLRLFRSANMDTCQMALELILDYLAKRPGEASHVLHILIEAFGFRHDSYIRAYEVQRAVVEALWQRAEGGSDSVYAHLLLAVASRYFHTHADTSESVGRGNMISIIRFDLVATPELAHLRRALWEHVFALHRQPALREHVIGVIQRYTQSGYQIADAEIIGWDAGQVLPFVSENLDPVQYVHCAIVQDYLDLLRRHGAGFPEELATRFTNDAYALAEVLSHDRLERMELGWEAYESERKRRLKEFFAGYGRKDYERFIDQCVALRASMAQEHQDHQLQASIAQVLVNLAEADASLFTEVLMRCLPYSCVSSLGLLGLAGKMMEIHGPDEAYELLTRTDYKDQPTWLFAFFWMLPPEQVRPDHLALLYALYENAECEQLFFGTDFLLKYLPLDADVFVRVTATLLQRAELEPRCNRFIAGLFDGFSETSNRADELLRSDMGVLKRAYFTAQEARDHVDYEGKAFDAILDLDPNFAREYVTWLYRDDRKPNRHDDVRNFTFIWRRADYEQVMDGVTECLFALERERIMFGGTYLDTFFLKHEGDHKDAEVIAERKKNALARWIVQRHDNAEFIQWLFKAIVHCASDDRLFFLALFLQHNHCFEDFRQLPLEPSSWSWSGSQVPMLQKRADFFASLLPMLNIIELLEHRQYVQRKIDYFREDIEREKKRDFMRE